jgi:hypothetical protein
VIALLWPFARISSLQGALNAQSAPAPPSAPAGSFVEVTQELGVAFQYRSSHTSKKYLLETMGSGVALFDYDNDGRLDIYLVNGAPLADPTPRGSIPRKTGPEYWNRLYHQKADGSFEDVTEKSGLQGNGYGMGVAVGDYDNDGFEDLYVTAYGGNKLYHNNGDGTFTDVTEKAGVSGGGWSTSAAWVDLDSDGFLDLIVLRYLDWDFDDIWCGEHKEGYRAYCHPDYFKPVAPLVYHNNHDGTFTEVAEKVGLGKPGKGLGVAIADYDRDGHPDLFIANDSMPEFLDRNRGDGTFEEIGLPSGVAVDQDGRTYAGMGVDFADYNNDGLPDIVVTDLANQRYAVYQNNGDGTFTYTTQSVGIGPMTLTHSGWGMRLFDYDNDGRVDAVVTTNDGQAHLLHNQTATKSHWILLKLIGHRSNRDAIGAVVTLVTSSGQQYATVSTASSYLSASDKRVHFGLGGESSIQKLEIRWPSGVRQTLTNVAVDQVLQIDEPAVTGAARP